MALRSKTDIVLLACGSFNPITNMHLRMFELARDRLEDTERYRVVKGIFSPVGDAYKKKGLIEARHRVEMARMATKSSTWITVDDWESQQEEWVETAKVMRHHHNGLLSVDHNSDDVDNIKSVKKRKMDENDDMCPGHSRDHSRSDSRHLMLLCGADLLESFAIPNLWKQEDIAEIVGRFGLVCVTRCGSNAEKAVYLSDMLYQHRKNIHIVQEWVTNDLSSTHVRRALSRGQSVRYLLPDSVVDYIQKWNLYSAESEQKNAGIVLAPLQKYAGKAE